MLFLVFAPCFLCLINYPSISLTQILHVTSNTKHYLVTYLNWTHFHALFVCQGIPMYPILFDNSELLEDPVGQDLWAPASGDWHWYDLCHPPYQFAPGICSWIFLFNTSDVWVIYSHLNYCNNLLTGLFVSNLVLLFSF